MAMTDKLDVKLNQNLWVLIISFASLGCGEYYEIKTLTSFATYICWISSISITVTLGVYTIVYIRNRFFKKPNS